MNHLESFILPWTQEPFPNTVRKEANLALEKFSRGESSPDIEAFSIPLEFGTGGMRGKLGNGIGRMNEFTVGRAALGFISYLSKKNKKASIVIAYDSRRRSKEFAEVTAGIAAYLGVKVILFKEVTPTPILSYAIRYYKASGGVVITASHNPPEYNGFKAYLSDGGQLVPPDDQKIISKIESITDWKQIPILSTKDPIYKKMVKFAGKDCFTSYKKDLSKAGILSISLKPKDRTALKIVYSPLHGTGGKSMQELLNSFGYKNVFLVPEQKDPNGEFPTVKYPNPEEAEAMELSKKFAIQKNAQAFIATDPDADRLGIGVKNENGEYVLFNGNQIGSIMAAYLCEAYSAGKKKKKAVLVKTIVTTDLQENIAKKNKVKYKNVLTGFKFIAQVMAKIDKSKTDFFLFGGEESFGYLPVSFVRDKDSLSSALLLLEILTEKKDLFNYMDEIYLKYGLFQESLKSLTLEGSAGKEKIRKSLESLRTLDLLGKKIHHRKITGILDYKTQIAKGNASKSAFSGCPSSDVIQVILEGNAKLTIRPSGTEPKIKIYSSFQSLKAPKSKEEIKILTKDLLSEIKTSEEIFLQLAGLS
ncbi:phospho-sugar mutase [Leptospira interrogans]|uniref:Phospho-sugar mutase n=3 Tax=Leptospira interrogans TaxID=173 RepID=A0AA40W9I3_LEPIR|nr:MULTISPECIES: phospho-sugar mutase [Leptospira]ASV05936.1 phospho-sugar mutase [Leptospira interrogans serovar Canicola]EJO79265.1 putative phosphoglucomutase [Leptospira interrogans serovar Pomona str. Kennewicki LC82-25]EKN99452.1 putative phosphoglucomutase [Leptospira interrogans serovar Pomona str. Pomona]EKO69773.1 putative phosphoglucomutase [Leptospira interrogans serovar Canicola str. Fiocruz LV133]EKR80545.1 putative phosphoglucomutase [Leptospira interrogans str. UI 08452]